MPEAPWGDELTIPNQPRAGEVVSGYRLERQFDQGSGGTVWAAFDLGLERSVVIKFISPELCTDATMVARFEREAKALARLEHPNIVPIYAVGRRGHQLFLVLKYLEGGTLYDYRVEVGGRVSPSRLLPLLRQLCAGLQHLHDSGFVHRDLKPDNVVVMPDGHVYLLDLGIVRDRGHGQTQSGTIIGTPAYMSPEQGRGARVDHRTDLYALGCIVFECLTGTPPFSAESDVDLILAHARQPPPSLVKADPYLPEALDAVVQRALAKSPSSRYAAAREVLAAIEAALEPQAAAHRHPTVEVSTVATVPEGSAAATSRGAGVTQRGAPAFVPTDTEEEPETFDENATLPDRPPSRRRR